MASFVRICNFDRPKLKPGQKERSEKPVGLKFGQKESLSVPMDFTGLQPEHTQSFVSTPNMYD